MVLRIMFVLGMACRSDAVILLETADPTRNTTTPGDNSGWQYEGKFGGFLGVPIAPHFFITAKHIGGSEGMVLDFHGDLYTTIAAHPSPTTDLQIWEVDHAKPFPTYAPLSSGGKDLGATATIFGCGAQRGDAVVVSNELKGWAWGTTGYGERWGKNVVTGTTDGGDEYGELLHCDFDSPGIASEGHLSVRDSGGGMFVLENGLWRLAGIHLSVDGPFRFSQEGAEFNAALYDKGGLDEWTGDPPDWETVPEECENIPSRFYSSRISASLPWILGVTQQGGTLPPESFTAWQRLYFSPTQIAAPGESGAMADFDGDGIGNLLEFALNLDPTFNEWVAMLPELGLSGLPSVRVETISGEDRVTIEFVRRTGASGSGLTYTSQFSSDLDDWSVAGTEIVEAINPRWERVKVVDSLTTLASSKRFARLRVTLAD